MKNPIHMMSVAWPQSFAVSSIAVSSVGVSMPGLARLLPKDLDGPDPVYRRDPGPGCRRMLA